MKELNNIEKSTPILSTMKNIQEQMQKHGNEMLKSYDLTLPQAFVLRELESSQNQQLTLKELEKILNIAQSTTVGLVSRLEKKGFVETLADEHDKRIKIAKLTKSGEELVLTVRKSIMVLEGELLSVLTQEEKEKFFELIEKIGSNIKNIK